MTATVCFKFSESKPIAKASINCLLFCSKSLTHQQCRSLPVSKFNLIYKTTLMLKLSFWLIFNYKMNETILVISSFFKLMFIFYLLVDRRALLVALTKFTSTICLMNGDACKFWRSTYFTLSFIELFSATEK